MGNAPRVFKPKPAEVYGRIEGPKGELGFYLIADGTPKPYRYRVRPPSLINLTVLRDMCLGGKNRRRRHHPRQHRHRPRGGGPMSILGGGIFKGMAVTLRNFVGSYFYTRSASSPTITRGAPMARCRKAPANTRKRKASNSATPPPSRITAATFPCCCTMAASRWTPFAVWPAKSASANARRNAFTSRRTTTRTANTSSGQRFRHRRVRLHELPDLRGGLPV